MNRERQLKKGPTAARRSDTGDGGRKRAPGSETYMKGNGRKDLAGPFLEIQVLFGGLVWLQETQAWSFVVFHFAAVCVESVPFAMCGLFWTQYLIR